MDHEEKGSLIVLSGPSGTGKGTILKRLLAKDGTLTASVSVTTRRPRPGETDGKDYYFVSKRKFEDMIKNSEFLEYTEYCGNYYGTPCDKVRETLNEGKDVILEIEVDGGSQIRKRCEDSIGIFISPPSVEALAERLAGRGSDSAKDVDERLSKARKEIGEALNYDYVVINDSVEECAERILNIIKCQRLKSHRMARIINEVLKNEYKTVGGRYVKRKEEQICVGNSRGQEGA